MNLRAAWLRALLPLCRQLAVVALVLTSATAHASVFEMFGAGPRAVAMAGALSAAARGGEAAFHNPALLGESRLAGVWFGANTTGNALSIELARPACTDTYLACRGRHLAGFASRQPTVPRDSSGFMVGWHYPLGGVFRNRVALGASLALPQRDILRISGPDPQTPQFVLYEGMPDRIAFLFAASWRVTERFSIGLGTQVLAVLDAHIDLDLDPTNHRMDHAAVRIGLDPRARLTAGTSLRATDRLWLGIGYRQRLSLEYAIPTTVKVGEALTADIDLGHETLFTPDVIHFGAAWRPLDRLLVATDLGLALWSQAPDPSPYVSIDVGGAAPAALGLGSLLDVGTDTPALDLHFVDTVSPALGLEWDAARALALRTGYVYRPSPAPRALGTHNYLDNHVHGISGGFSWRFGRFSDEVRARLGPAFATGGPPTGEAVAPMAIDAGAQVLLLPRRTVLKADANDPIGDLSHGGAVWHLGVSFSGSF